MSDTFRTRIAAVQRDHRLVTRMVGRKAEKSCLCGWRSPERDCTFTDHPEHVADAVIAELHLRQEFSVEYTPEGEYPPQRQRYEWSCGHERVTEHRDQAEFDAKSFYEDEPEEKPQVVTRYVTEWETD